jgi:hypothetical protein
MNFIQGYVNIALSRVSTFLYLNLPLFTFNIVYKNLMYSFYIPLY